MSDVSGVSAGLSGSGVALVLDGVHAIRHAHSKRPIGLSQLVSFGKRC